jgi:hypothetical protein
MTEEDKLAKVKAEQAVQQVLIRTLLLAFEKQAPGVLAGVAAALARTRAVADWPEYAQAIDEWCDDLQDVQRSARGEPGEPPTGQQPLQ